MSFLRKRGPKPAEITQYTGLQIQTSSSAVPIPICYGINKIAPNLLWYGVFGAYPEYTKSGGKGGGRKTISGYHYSSALVVGLCEGPIASIGAIWKDQGIYSAEALNFNIDRGIAASPTLAYLQDITYKGVANAWSPLYDLGSSASIGALQFEVCGQRCSTAVVNAHDADPAEVIFDFLTSEQYGVGFPAGSIDASTLFGSSGGASYQAYCQSVGIGMSPVLANRETASSIMMRWLQLTNSVAVWSEGKLKFIPYGDESVNGILDDLTPVTFVPSITPLYDLTDDDFVSGGDDEDPVLVERKDPYSAFNVQGIEISDRKNRYNSSTITVWDQNAIERYGRRDGSTVTAHEICDMAIAQKVGQLMLQREIYIRNTYSFRLSFEFCLLEPMDIVTLTDLALGLDKAVVRVISIDEDDDGVLSVIAEEFPGSIGTTAAYQVQESEAQVLDWNVAPSAVNVPVIFEPPSSLTNGQRQVWLAVSGGFTSVRRIAEDSSTGAHLVSMAFPSLPSGSAVTFSVYVRPGDRTVCRLGIFDGVSVQGITFDLATGVASGATMGIASSSIVPVIGGLWYQVSISCAMAILASPKASIELESPAGTMTYAGISGQGLFVWNPEFAAAGNTMSVTSTSMMPSGVTVELDAQDPPLEVVSRADQYWGGCAIYVSTDDATYTQIGQINGPARHGRVTGYAEATLTVDLAESGASLDPVSVEDAQNAITLSLVGDELLAYGGVALTGENAYNLTNLVRSLYGTSSVSHAVGERFARLDNAIFKYTLPAGYVGRTLYLKFQSFNIFGLGLQDLSTCRTYTYIPNGAGAGIGPILQQLALGVDVDLGSIADPVSIEEELGGIASSPSVTVDLGSIA